MNILSKIEHIEESRRRALDNAVGSLRLDRTLPLNVFQDGWRNFHFFESDLIFRPNFVEVMNLLLDEEEANVCCLVNLGATVQNDYSNPQAIYVGHSTDAPQYMALLRGDGSPKAWLYLVDRYVCASDKGEWTIYCEKENDIAVVGFRTKVMNEFSCPLKLLQATSIDMAQQAPRDDAFDFDKLTSRWLTTLVEQYSGH